MVLLTAMGTVLEVLLQSYAHF